MKHLFASMLMLAGLALAGCDKDTSKDVNTASDKTASQASDAMNKVKGDVKEGVNQAKDAAKQGADAAASNLEAMQKNIDDLIAKAKAAVKDKKWSDAEAYIANIKSMETRLPQPAQDKINAALADVQKMIDAGKQLTPSK